METAVNWMQAGEADWIGLVGHSLGANVALLTARQDASIRAVCRLAGRTGVLRPDFFLSPVQRETLAAEGQVAFTSRGRDLLIKQAFMDDAQSHDLTDATRALTIPMLVVHGDRDEVIPVAEAHTARRGQSGKGRPFTCRGCRSYVLPAGRPDPDRAESRRLVP